MKHLPRHIALLLLILLSACTGTGTYDTANKCYLVIDNSVHLDPTLMSAMNSMSPGIFCRISLGMKGGAETYFAQSNQNSSTSFALNGVDKARTRILGIYDECGLIVGFGNLDSPAVFYAYDAACPNCYSTSSLVRILKMNSAGIAECSDCKRTYNLNTGGNLISGEDGRQLYRYRASTTGPQGVLTVSN